MNELLKLKDELIAVKVQLAAVDLDSPEFSADNWDKMTAQKAILERKIQQKEIELADQEEANMQAQMAVTPAALVAPEAGTQTITSQQDSFATLPAMGYQCGGELLADHIAIELNGKMSNDSPDQFRARRYQHYCDSQNIHHAAGTASTITDGLEIIPELLPGVREYGQGLGVNQVLQAFRPINTSRKETDYFINEDTYNTNGLVVARIQEGGTFTAQEFSNKLERFRLNKVAIFAKITEEDFQNVPLLQTRYMDRAPATIDVQKVTDIISGAGTGIPIGFTTDANTAAVTVVRGGNDAISYTDLANLEKQYFAADGNGMYFTNQTTLAQLVNLQDGSGALIWKTNRNDGIENDPLIRGTLNGRPLVVSEDMPALGAKGDIALVNPAGYIFSQHTSGIRFAESMHFFFNADAQAFRWISQYGGRPAFKNAYTPRNTTSSPQLLSHFVLLAANV